MGKGIFAGNRLRRPVRLHRPRIDAPGQLGQALAPTAEGACQLQRRQLAQLGDGIDAKIGQPALPDLADSGQQADRQRCQESLHLAGPDHKQAVGLAPVRGDLGQELVWRHAGRGGQAKLVADGDADRLGNGGGR